LDFFFGGPLSIALDAVVFSFAACLNSAVSSSTSNLIYLLSSSVKNDNDLNQENKPCSAFHQHVCLGNGFRGLV